MNSRKDIEAEIIKLQVQIATKQYEEEVKLCKSEILDPCELHEKTGVPQCTEESQTACLFETAQHKRLADLYSAKCADFDILQAENQGLKANAMILNAIIENNLNPLDKDKIVRLIMENSGLKSELAHYQQLEAEGQTQRIILGNGEIAITECVDNLKVCLALKKQGKHKIGTICSNAGIETVEELNPDLIIQFNNIAGLEVLMKKLNDARNIFTGDNPNISILPERLEVTDSDK